jgi:putative transposase
VTVVPRLRGFGSVVCLSFIPTRSDAMSFIKTFRFRLRFRPACEARLRRYVGMCRWVWNSALAEQKARYARGEKYAGYVEMAHWLTSWRNAPATAWLAQGPVHTQQQVLRRLDQAYRRFFGKTGGMPSFKRHGQHPSLRFPAQFELDAANERIKLPKLGWLRLRMSRPVEGILRNVTVTREGEKWFASIQVRQQEAIAALELAPTLGIDLGLTVFAATSDGRLIAPVRALAKRQRQLKYLQRTLARKRRGSSNRRKAVRRLANLHRRIARQRLDWLHKLTARLADQHAVIALENLSIKNMSASARKTNAPARENARAKASLNRSILDAAWGEFARQLSYKTHRRGGSVVFVNPAYSSRSCRICGHESAENRKTQSVFRCMACGHTENADLHAAQNVLAAGHAVWAKEHASPPACGEAVRRCSTVESKCAASVKQEPTEALTLA